MVHTFSLYLWARRFNRRYGKKDLPAYIFLTDNTRVPDIERTIKQLPRQSLIIIRDYDMPKRDAYVKNIIALAHRCKHKVLVAGSEMLAVRYKADGLHCPEWMAKKAGYYKSCHPKWMVSVSVHTHKYADEKVDFILLSPVFPTQSHPGVKPMGLLRFRNICMQYHHPVYPLGGVEDSNVIQLKTVSTPGIAAIAALAAKA